MLIGLRPAVLRLALIGLRRNYNNGLHDKRRQPGSYAHERDREPRRRRKFNAFRTGGVCPARSGAANEPAAGGRVVVPGGIPLGSRDGGLSGRRLPGRRREGEVHLGHLRPHAGEDEERRHRRRRDRPLSAIPGRRGDDEGHRRHRLSLFHFLAARFSRWRGEPNPKGLDFYSRLVDELLSAGIEPFATLYHWDLPQALQDKHGGWQSRETSKAFGDYSGYVASHLSDRVKNFFTINEFQSFVEIGHRGLDLVIQGKPLHIENAPGLKLDNAALNQVRHHAVLGHGLSVQAIRAVGRAGTKVGPAEVLYTAVPAIDAPHHVKAAQAATRDLNAAYLSVILEGRYSATAICNRPGPTRRSSPTRI